MSLIIWTEQDRELAHDYGVALEEQDLMERSVLRELSRVEYQMEQWRRIARLMTALWVAAALIGFWIWKG